MRVVEASRHRSSCCHASWRIAIDWGVYGAPETFLVDANGKVVHKHVAPISVQIWEQDFLPLLQKAQSPGQPKAGTP